MIMIVCLATFAKKKYDTNCSTVCATSEKPHFFTAKCFNDGKNVTFKI